VYITALRSPASGCPANKPVFLVRLGQIADEIARQKKQAGFLTGLLMKKNN
jgi:hypothetical protein